MYVARAVGLCVCLVHAVGGLGLLCVYGVLPDSNNFRWGFPVGQADRKLLGFPVRSRPEIPDRLWSVFPVAVKVKISHPFYHLYICIIEVVTRLIIILYRQFTAP